MIRIGANPIGWSNDDMVELGGHIPLEQCLTEAKQAGFVGMELGNKFPRDAAKLKPILDAHGLALVSGWYSTFLIERDADAEFAAAQAHAGLLKAMGCTVLIAAECTRTVHGDKTKTLAERPVMSDAEWRRFATGLTAFAEKLAGIGLTLVYHHHMGTVVQTGAEIDRLMAETGNAVKLLLDTGHATWGGADPAALARRYRDRIAHVHTKDVRRDVMARAGAENWSFLKSVVEGVYTVPGDGMIDFVSAFRELKGYSGWVVVEAEQDPEKANPATYAKMGCDNVRRFLKEARLG
ncbi:2-keto-myo-inositol dehydratase [Rhizobiales bacterium GAS191]|nr:2-keto-myo-inositol dehydratase [Rhizobiales bacterium GAS113]SEC85864.1 2-keto-myo-inositol dehydratase [Rhizobiales bacterium GAS191]